MRSIIICPICQQEGTRFNLAEYLPDGSISILTRYTTYKGEIIPMFIQGNDYQLICGVCKQTAFKKIPILIQQSQILIGTQI